MELPCAAMCYIADCCFSTRNLARNENVEKAEGLKQRACLEFGGAQCKGRVSVPTNEHVSATICEITHTKVINDVFKNILDLAPLVYLNKTGSVRLMLAFCSVCVCMCVCVCVCVCACVCCSWF